MKIEGGCLCGKVRYSADAEPAFVGVCHCKNCQKGTGTAFAVVVALPKPALSVQGNPKTFDDHGDSGQILHRRFCSDCGSSLFDEAQAMPGVVMILAGTLDDFELGQAGNGDLHRQCPVVGQPRRRPPALPQDAGPPLRITAAGG